MLNKIFVEMKGQQKAYNFLKLRIICWCWFVQILGTWKLEEFLNNSFCKISTLADEITPDTKPMISMNYRWLFCFGLHWNWWRYDSIFCFVNFHYIFLKIRPFTSLWTNKFLASWLLLVFITRLHNCLLKYP